MFAGTPADPIAHNHLVVEIQGVLASSAEVRTKVVGNDHHPVPVLCMDVKPLTSFGQLIHAEQIYTEATRPAAERKAATLKKGVRVTLITTLSDMRTFLPHVESVTSHAS
ncbi:MAG: hypothetical protein EOP02_25275 [Proteobacteria bacterium]|nr:MAG: hypothetical protein EOP02_25275 [Pseudomonadota bacterium]